MDFTIKSRYGQVVLNKPVFFSLIVYQWSVIRQSSSTPSNLNTCISEASWPILIKFMCSITGMGERLHKVLGQIGSKLWFPWQQKPPLTLTLALIFNFNPWGYIHVLNHEHNCIKSDFKEISLKFATSG